MSEIGLRSAAAGLPILVLALVSIPNVASRQGEGTIAGKVVLVGLAPSPPPPATVKPADAPACGAHVPDESLRVAVGGGVRDVIVYIENAPAAAAPAGTVQLTNHTCR